MVIVLSNNILEKLASKHGVKKDDVEQCFANRTGKYLADTREEHLSTPPTYWFIAETNFGRLLKVAFIAKDGDIFIRTSYPPNEEEIRIYKKYAEIAKNDL